GDVTEKPLGRVCAPEGLFLRLHSTGSQKGRRAVWSEIGEARHDTFGEDRQRSQSVGVDDTNADRLDAHAGQPVQAGDRLLDGSITSLASNVYMDVFSRAA